MKNTYYQNWDRLLERFEGWWSGEDIGRPLMRVCAAKHTESLPPVKPRPNSLEECYTDADYISQLCRRWFSSLCFLGDAYPSASADLGPGSLALYLGGEPHFAPDTVWYTSVIEDPAEFRKLHFDPENPWYQKHQAMMQELFDRADGDYMVNLPDMIENADILSALRGPQEFCFDLMDSLEDVKAGLSRLDELYFQYYDTFYEMLRQDGCSSFTAFQVYGKGRVAKLQCDFSAMISPEMYRELIQPSIRKQCQKLDHSIYHLDGPDAIKHVDAIMEIKELQALQWTCGAGQPDGTCERWYPIYDKVREAGKSLWIMVYDGSISDWQENTRKIISRYGRKGLYFLYPDFPDPASGQQFLDSFDPGNKIF